MKCIKKLKPEVGLWWESAPKPKPRHNEVLIKVKHTSVCGTDLHIYDWDSWAQKNVPTPLITGHEFMGVIEEMGPSVYGYEVGQRVSGEGHIVCGVCRSCRAGKRHLCGETKVIGVHTPGCFAEYLVLPASNIFPLPDDIPDEVGAILDPLGNAVHTALSYDLIGEDVLITGAGPIGLMAAMICRHVGARHIVITDVQDKRLSLAKKLGIDFAINPQKQDLREVMNILKMQEGFDVGLEMSGSPHALNQMLECCKMGANIALLGILPPDAPVDMAQVIFRGLNIKGVFGREMFETWYKMATMIQGGLNMTPIITHRFAARDYMEAITAMKEGLTGKVILNWED